MNYYNIKMNRSARKFVSLSTATLAFMLLILAFFSFFSTESIEQTIRSSRQIENSFLMANNFLQDFKSTHGQMPNEAEFNNWTNSQPDKAYSARSMRLITSSQQFPSEIKKFGSPSPSQAYIIEYGRGDSFEYFIPWTNTSTLVLEKGKFYYFGSSLMDGVIFFVLSFILAITAVYIWPHLRKPG